MRNNLLLLVASAVLTLTACTNPGSTAGDPQQAHNNKSPSLDLSGAGAGGGGGGGGY